MARILCIWIVLLQTIPALAGHRNEDITKVNLPNDNFERLGGPSSNKKKAKLGTKSLEFGGQTTRLLTGEKVDLSSPSSRESSPTGSTLPETGQSATIASAQTNNGTTPNSEALQYTAINQLDNGTRVKIVGKDKDGNLTIAAKGGMAKVVEVPITGDTLRAFQQSKFRQEGVQVSLTQALGIKSPQESNIVALQFTDKPRGLTSFFGIPVEKYNYYYPTDRAMQSSMNSGSDAQMSLVFYQRLPNGELTPWAGGGGMGGGAGEEPL